MKVLLQGSVLCIAICFCTKVFAGQPPRGQEREAAKGQERGAFGVAVVSQPTPIKLLGSPGVGLMAFWANKGAQFALLAENGRYDFDPFKTTALFEGVDGSIRKGDSYLVSLLAGPKFQPFERIEIAPLLGLGQRRTSFQGPGCGSHERCRYIVQNVSEVSTEFIFHTDSGLRLGMEPLSVYVPMGQVSTSGNDTDEAVQADLDHMARLTFVSIFRVSVGIEFH